MTTLTAPSASRRTVLGASAVAAGTTAAGLLGVASAPRAAAATRATTTSPLAPGLALTVDPAWHLARRLSPAPDQRLADHIRAVGGSAWLAAQLAPATVKDTTCDALLAKYFPLLDSTSLDAAHAFNGDAFRGGAYVQRATLLRRIHSERHVLESMVEFWGDLLYVPFSSSKSAAWIMHYDRYVIRKDAFGRYRDMLYAALTHPALIAFLDNQGSSKHNINENLGRELLELFSVGTGNYTEDDVKASARLLTGHTIDWPRYAYGYRPSQHYVGPVKVMGFSHPNASAQDGPTTLAAYATYLARHPATAQRIARRLAVRFVSDTPSQALVDQLAAVYRSSDTAILPVLRTLFASSEFLGSTGHKLRRPGELILAAVRSGRPTTTLTRAPLTEPWSALRTINSLHDLASHVPREWPAVNGYPDVAAAWSSSATTVGRWRAVQGVAERWDKEVIAEPWTTLFGITLGANTLAVARQIILQLSGFEPDAAARDAVAAMLHSGGSQPPSATSTISSTCLRYWVDEAVAIALFSPQMLLR